MIPYGHQSIDDDDIAAVVAVLKGDWLTQGPAVDEFEARLCDYTGARHAVAFANGTAALHGAAWAARLGDGDRVATSPLTFVASANCARFVGAAPILVDIDPETLNIDLAQLPSDIDALVAVHYAGLPVDLAALTRDGRRPRVVIEDAAHAIGAHTPDGPIGNCARSDLCCFSFHPVKTMTTGEGGAVTTNDDDLADRLRRFRSHGIVRRGEQAAWSYDIDEIGFNYRLTDIQAALGTSQLAKLDRFVAKRQRIADRYRMQLAPLQEIQLPPAAPDGARHAYHLFPIRVDDRRRIFDGLRARGVGVQVHYIPVHRLAAYADAFGTAAFPVADAECERLISLPMFPDLTEDDQDHVVAALADLLEAR